MMWWQFWKRRDPLGIEKMFTDLPETILYKGRVWGLRIKKERGKVYVRYVTVLERGKLTKTKFIKKTYDSISAGGARSLQGALRKMHKRLEKLDY